jgi:hypothetical protein
MEDLTGGSSNPSIPLPPRVAGEATVSVPPPSAPLDLAPPPPQVRRPLKAVDPFAEPDEPSGPRGRPAGGLEDLEGEEPITAANLFEEEGEEDIPPSPRASVPQERTMTVPPPKPDTADGYALPPQEGKKAALQAEKPKKQAKWDEAATEASESPPSGIEEWRKELAAQASSSAALNRAAPINPDSTVVVNPPSSGVSPNIPVAAIPPAEREKRKAVDTSAAQSAFKALADLNAEDDDLDADLSGLSTRVFNQPSTFGDPSPQPKRLVEEEEEEEEAEEDVKVWYVAIEDEQQGPFDVDALTEMWREGNFDSDSLCWKEGFDDWIEVAKAKELRFLLDFPQPKLDLPDLPAEPSLEKSIPGDVDLPFDAPAGAKQAPLEDDWVPSAGSALASLAAAELSSLVDEEPGLEPPRDLSKPKLAKIEKSATTPFDADESVFKEMPSKRNAPSFQS